LTNGGTDWAASKESIAKGTGDDVFNGEMKLEYHAAEKMFALTFKFEILLV
jgi:hypothetical protein